MIWPWVVGGAVAAIGSAGGFTAYEIGRRGIHRWLSSFLLNRRRRPEPGKPIDVLIAICDHYEPKRGDATPAKAKARVQRWLDEYPRLFDRFRDSDGCPPRHSFFYPAEEYEAEYLDMLARLCRAGYGEVEVHLHHDNDTADNLRETLLGFKKTLSEQHGLLSRDRETGEVVYGFIHGNWALDNSRRDGRWCGINNELDVLVETGCYADFTMPSAPSETQTRQINSIYWAVDDPARPKSHDTGIELGLKPRPDKGLLMIQGPLGLDWGNRKYGVFPRIENGNLQKTQPPSAKRLDLWLRACVNIINNPTYLFVKLHSHGVAEPNQDVLLGEPMVRFHEALRERAGRDSLFRFHYVTAREMANIALALAAGERIEVHDARSFRYVPVG